jgi:hypothetical protein
MYPWGGAPGKDGVAEYSHGVRQEIVQLFRNETDFVVYSVDPGLSHPGYGSDVSHSQFCLAPSGAGWGIRLAEMMVEGCIPVIIQDNVTQPWEEVLPYHRFSLRVKEADVPTLPAILRELDQVGSPMSTHPICSPACKCTHGAPHRLLTDWTRGFGSIKSARCGWSWRARGGRWCGVACTGAWRARTATTMLSPCSCTF